MAEQITIVLSANKVPLFRLFIAQPPQKDFRLVSEEPYGRPLPGDEIFGQKMSLTIQTEDAWNFFYLGADWTLFEQEGGPRHG